MDSFLSFPIPGSPFPVAQFASRGDWHWTPPRDFPYIKPFPTYNILEGGTLDPSDEPTRFPEEHHPGRRWLLGRRQEPPGAEQVSEREGEHRHHRRGRQGPQRHGGGGEGPQRRG